MFWKILQPHYWIIDRKVRATNRFIFIALTLLLLYGGQWFYENLIRDNLALLNSERAVMIIASFLPLEFFIVLLFALLGVSDVIYQLYLASDLELLMIAPVSFRIIFSVKLLQCSRATLIPVLTAGAFLMALGLAHEAAVSYYLLVVVLLLATMAIATTFVMLLVILLARFLPVRKVRSWIPVVAAMTMFGLMLLQQSGTQWLLSQTSLIEFLTDALLNPEQLGLAVAGFAGSAMITILAASLIFDTAFHEGWNRFREVSTQKSIFSFPRRRHWNISQLLGPLPNPLRFIIEKEWLEILHDPRSIINLVQPLILVVAILAPFIAGGIGSEILRPLIFLIMLMLLPMSLCYVPMGTSLMAILQEGRKIALLRSMPVSMSDVLKGKLLATLIPMVVSWVFVFVLAGLWLQYPIWQIGALAGITSWGLVGASVATVAIGGQSVDFIIEDLRKRISVVMTYFIIAVNLIFVLSTVAASIWLMVRFFPVSREILAIQALSDYSIIGWIFSKSAWSPLVLISFQIFFWVGIKLLWDATIRRLEGWEEN